MDPLTELQERLAHQELAIEELTRALLAQEEHCRALERRLARLAERLQRLERDGEAPFDPLTERPPHY